MRTPTAILLLSTVAYSTVAVPDSPTQQPLGQVDNGPSANGLPFATSALEKYIEGAMEKWHAPGVAVAIVNGNETWAKVSSSHPTHRNLSVIEAPSSVY